MNMVFDAHIMMSQFFQSGKVKVERFTTKTTEWPYHGPQEDYEEYIGLENT